MMKLGDVVGMLEEEGREGGESGERGGQLIRLHSVEEGGSPGDRRGRQTPLASIHNLT
jgi:hypothetical protein